MNDVICRYIDERMKRCEEIYDINVIAWFLRDKGIPRKNSDLDIVFLFKNRADRKCRAIHDIIGYGFDFWGWDIYDALETVARSHEYFYLNPSAELEDIYISAEHKRGGLGYYGGIFWMVGNSQIGGNASFLKEGIALLNEIMEKKIIISYLLEPLEKRIETIEYTNCLSSYEYLNTLWRLLVSQNILLGGKSGETNFTEMANKYVGEETLPWIKILINVYNRALSKHSQRFSCVPLNKYVIMEFKCLKLEMEKLLPEKEKRFNSVMKNLEDLL